MAEIKVKPKGTIKKLEKEVVQVQKFKNNLITAKEKVNEFTINESNNTAEDYASQKIQNDISYVSRRGAVKANEIGKKSLKETQENFIKGKQKVEILKSRIKQNRAKDLKNVIEKTNKTIKSGTKQSIKTAKNTTTLTKKGIKTTEQVAKNSKIVAKESVKMTQRAIKLSKKAVQTTIKATKVAIKATIKTVKAIIAATKAIISAIAAGGWVAVVINWFKDKNEWHDRGESYYPIIGDIIFFDWYDENGKQDGNCDHVGIVTRTDIDNRNIYTIEGNTSNKCAERMYSFDDVQVMGYGSPKYE